MKILVLIFTLFFTSLTTAGLDFRTELSESRKVVEIIHLHSDSRIPDEISYRQTGKFLLCLNRNGVDFLVYPVTRRTFRRGELSVRVFCLNGKIIISKGFT